MSPAHEQELLTLKNYVEKMPTFSPATTKIIQLANSMNATANEIVTAIRMDPILTGKVLQLVNSAYFALAQKITSLNRALVYLGINTIKNLALSTAVVETFDTRNAELAARISPAWRHSLAAAVCCKTIAKLTHVPNTLLEEYFVAGLLHDLGKIILIQAFHGSLDHNGRLTPDEEKSRYGLSHSEVGGIILKRWHFPEELSEAVAHHHGPSESRKLACFLHVADAMTYRLELNSTPAIPSVGAGSAAAVLGALTPTPPQKAPEILPEVWKILGVTEAAVLDELKSAKEQIEKAEIFLNIASSKERVVEHE